jgi:hypothetical protein
MSQLKDRTGFAPGLKIIILGKKSKVNVRLVFATATIRLTAAPRCTGPIMQ